LLQAIIENPITVTKVIIKRGTLASLRMARLRFTKILKVFFILNSLRLMSTG
jgi:hypothetical protein